MHVQALIDARPDWLEYLTTELKINVVRDGDLVSLKYDQIESPMDNPVVQECRGIVVDTSDGTILAHPYNKFWNHGESQAARIDWSTARVQEKLDGSLMILYFDRGVWNVASSGTPTASGGFGKAHGAEFTFRDAFWELFNSLGMLLPPVELADVCFMFELCADANRIVVKHDKHRLVVHGARDLTHGNEWSRAYLEMTAEMLNWEIVREFPIGTIEEALDAANEMNPLAQEGFVVVDGNFNRVKIKSPRYVALHHMKGEATPRRAIELWQTGETSELLAHFPEMAEAIMPIHAKLDSAAQGAYDDIIRYAATPTRKEYASLVKDKPWSAVCFRYYGKAAPSLDDVKGEMRGQTPASLERLAGVA